MPTYIAHNGQKQIQIDTVYADAGFGSLVIIPKTVYEQADSNGWYDGCCQFVVDNSSHYSGELIFLDYGY